MTSVPREDVAGVVCHLASIRRALNITQESLADRINTSRKRLVQIEKGRITPTITEAVQIADLVGKDILQIWELPRREPGPGYERFSLHGNGSRQARVLAQARAVERLAFEEERQTEARILADVADRLFEVALHTKFDPPLEA